MVVTTTRDMDPTITSMAVDTAVTMAATEVDMIIATTITAAIEDVTATLPPLMTAIITTIITIIIMIIMVMSLIVEGTVRTDHITTREDVVEDILDQTMVVVTTDIITMEEIHTSMVTLVPTQTTHHTTQLHHTAPLHTIVMAIMVENLTTNLNTKLKNTEALLPMEPATKAMRIIHHQLIQVMKIGQLIMLHHTKIIILDLINCLSFLIIVIQIIYISLKSRLNLNHRFFHK